MSIKGNNAEYTIISLLRDAENKFCADCNCPLVEQSSVSACISHRIWICASCSMLHLERLKGCNIKHSKFIDGWTSKDVICMTAAKSNVAMNKFYEKYIPDWLVADRISSYSSLLEKEIWISAKYDDQAFAFPNNIFFKEKAAEEKAAKKKKKKEQAKSANVMRENLPTRLVDFYLLVGRGKLRADSVFNSPVPTTPRKGSSSRSHSRSGSPSRSRKGSDAGLGSSADSRRGSLTAAPKKNPALLFTPSLQSSYPTLNYYNDFEMPDSMLASLIFPNGIALQFEDKPPRIFPFILTLEDYNKLYCVALVFHEIVEPSEITSLHDELSKQAAINGETESVDIVLKPLVNKVIYSPKAMVMVSHFPFYHYMSVSLSKIYRISLSVSPLPLENFIVQVVHEVPLPPQGRVEVVLPLADSIIHISRPPNNSLPMVDFSYRPLFSLLSVDSILTIFRCILVEFPVCFYSSNVSLLTPVCEAMLSLIFPFSWTCPYSLIFTRSMIDLLDSPFPFVYGVSKELLLEVRIDRRNENVLYVDIDNNGLFMGPERIREFHNDAPLNEHIPPLPKHDFAKLRTKLLQVTDEIKISEISKPSFLASIGMPFRNQEYMTPISSNSLLGQGVALASKARKQANMKDSAPADIFDNSICTGSTIEHSLGTSPNVIDHVNFLDPQFNQSSIDNFDAKEIRLAFLRFFVALFIDYQDFLVYAPIDKSAVDSARVGADKGRPATDKPKPRPSVSGANVASAKRTSSPHPGENPTGFDNDEFLVHVNKDPFIDKLMQTQMFDTYIQERVRDRDQPEILVFDESIVAKHNRSSVTLRKKETPFITDRSNTITSSFTCQGPSTWGVAPGKQFTYTKVPLVPSIKYDLVRFPKPLVEAPEKTRARAHTKVEFADATNNFLASMHAIDQITYSNDSPDGPDGFDSEIYAFSAKLEAIHNRNDNLVKSIITFQQLYHYYRFRKAFSLLGKGSKVRRQYVKSVVLLQSIWRMRKIHKSYQLAIVVVRLRNKASTGIQCHIKGLLTRKHVYRLKTEIRGKRIEVLNLLWHLEHTPLHHRAAVLTYIRTNSSHVFAKESSIASTVSASAASSSRPLSSAFADPGGGGGGGRISFLSLSILAAEISRILYSFDIVNDHRLFKNCYLLKPCFVKSQGLRVVKDSQVSNSNSNAISEKMERQISYNALAYSFEKSDFFGVMKKSIGASGTTMSALRSALFLSTKALSHITSQETMELNERGNLYNIMKEVETKDNSIFTKTHLLDDIFTLANMPVDNKLKKHTLSESLWRDFDSRTLGSDAGFANALIVYDKIRSLSEQHSLRPPLSMPVPTPSSPAASAANAIVDAIDAKNVPWVDRTRALIVNNALLAVARSAFRREAKKG